MAVPIKAMIGSRFIKKKKLVGTSLTCDYVIIAILKRSEIHYSEF